MSSPPTLCVASASWPPLPATSWLGLTTSRPFLVARTRHGRLSTLPLDITGGLVVVCCCGGAPPLVCLDARPSSWCLYCCVVALILCVETERRQKLVVRITRNIVPGKEPVFHVTCTPHEPGTTNFKCESIEMVNPRGLPIASGFVVFVCVFVVES